MHKFYIADTHFGHEAIIRMTGRPFASADEMDEVMIDYWNRAVSHEDEVCILGDFMFKSRRASEYYLNRLPGKKHLIAGNHEGWTRQVNTADYFESVGQMKEIADSGRHLVLCHYPMAEWPRFYKGSLHLFGHIHNNREGDAFRYYRRNPRMLNAGVEINGYTPVRLERLIENNDAFRKEQGGAEGFFVIE